MFRTLSSRFVDRLRRDANCNPRAVRIHAVVQVIPVIRVCDVNIIGLVPGVSPVFRIRINHTEPMASVLEARIPALHTEGEAGDAEIVIRTIVAAVRIVRNAIAVVAAALLPIAVLRLPVLSAIPLPVTLLLRNGP